MTSTAQVESFGRTGSFRIAVLSGAGAGAPNLRGFVASPSDVENYTCLVYPGWRRYTDDGFEAQVLIDDLANEIAGWSERVVIIGFSLGGHLGYALALKLQSLSVEVLGLCIIDAFPISSADIRPGSIGRHLARLRAMALRSSLGRLGTEVRLLIWRALIRVAGDRAATLTRRWRDSGFMRALCALDPAFEKELDMRLLIRATASWLSKLDRNPVPLHVPVVHLRTAGAIKGDAAWRARCPHIEFVEISGRHDLLLDAENLAYMRRAFIGATRNWG